jgi:hypothetical protein
MLACLQIYYRRKAVRMKGKRGLRDIVRSERVQP